MAIDFHLHTKSRPEVWLLSATSAPQVSHLTGAGWFRFLVVLAALLVGTEQAGLATGTSPDDPIPFNAAGGELSLTLPSSSTGIWLQFSPPVSLQATHFELQTTGTLDTVLDVYANRADVTAGDALASDDDSGTGINAFLRIPIGFAGPFLARVRGYGGATGATRIASSLTAEPAGRCDWPSGCSLAAAAKDKPTGLTVLHTLRRVDREVLSLSARGRELSALYWRISADLLPSLAIDSSLRDSVFERVEGLLPLAEAALAALGTGDVAPAIVAGDVERIAELLHIVTPHLSPSTAASLTAAWLEFDLTRQAGRPVAEVMALHGLLPNPGRKVTLLAKLRTLPALATADKRTGIALVDRALEAQGIGALRAVHPDTPALRDAGLARTVAIEVNAGERARNLLSTLAALPEVEWVEESGEIRALAATSDPFASQLWGLDAIHAPQAWSLTRGQCSTLVAVVDTGVRADLLDLAGNNLVAKGYDFANDDADPTDRHGHGSHVTGTLAAAADNSASIAGVAPGICFFAVKVLSDSGTGTYEDVAAGIRYAADQGAKVINISAGCDCYSQAIEDALAYAAGQRDVLVVAASGNDGAEGVYYPAASPWALAVGAVDRDLSLATFSNWGPELDLVAPGVDIVSTFKNGESCLGSGTSMASPHVAGVAALARSLNPESSRAQVVDSLRRNATDLGLHGPDSMYGSGLVDAAATIRGLARISVSGPAQGSAMASLQFAAAASGCTPDPDGWIWESRPASSSFLGGEQRTSQALLSWSDTGTYEVRASNTRCAEAVGSRTVNIGSIRPQEFRLTAADNQIRSNRPTLVFVHGWQQDFDWALGAVAPEVLWSCVRDCDSRRVDHPVAALLARPDLNVLQFVWSGAATETPWGASGNAPAAANWLSTSLQAQLGASYDQPIQFVGHSLGTVVSAQAAAQLATALPHLESVQVTALDRPDSLWFSNYGPDFFPATLAGAVRPDLSLKLDNYWSSSGWGTGALTQGVAGARTYNHRRPQPRAEACPGCPADYDDGLKNPGQLGDLFFAHDGNNDHSGVHEWFRWTMNPESLATGTCTGADPIPWTMPSGQWDLHGSLNPCANGWHWSILGPHPEAFPTSPESDVPAVVGEPIGSGALSQSQEGWASTSLNEQIASDRNTTSGTIRLPPGTRALALSLSANHSAPSDNVAVLLDSFPIWSGQAGLLREGVPFPIGPLPVSVTAGDHRLEARVVGNRGTQVGVSNLRAVRVIPTCSLPSTLCVTNSRFRVDADWEDHEQNRGEARPRTVAASDSGFFWFFNQDNLELVVKVLDGCGVNQRFWVFAAGMTDVGVRLRVTDTWTGEVRRFESPRGTPFQPIQDTAAFATCGAAAAHVEAGTGVLLEGPELADLPGAHDAADARVETESTRLQAEPDRSVSGSELLLNGNRFAVSARWRTATGANGEGTPVALTADAGYFWFFDPGNIELIVKVLDGCALNQRFWVYAGGLTDVQVTLDIRDTVTGATRTYSNGLGVPFRPIQDTSAFAVCR